MSIVVNYPKFLEKVQLPLMQPAIAQVLHEVRLPDLIAEYACPADQLETRGMIAFFEKEIPPERIQRLKNQLPETASSFEEIPCKKMHLFRGSTAIENSTVRKLVALTSVYFGYRCRLHLNELKLDVPLTSVEPNLEFHDFLGRVPGCTIIQRCDPKTDLRLCHTFTFGHLAWYKTIAPSAKLFTEPERVLNFLQSKGFKKDTKPSQGQIVVYHTATTTSHFARVVRIEGDKIIVWSKFGPFHVYEHSIEVAQYHYGNSVTFLNPPAK